MFLQDCSVCLCLFLYSVYMYGDHVCACMCVCVDRSHARPSHLSLLCIRCMLECASGKRPHYFNAAYFPAPHTGLFLSLLWHGIEENPRCVCVCVRVHTPSHLVTSDAAVGSLLCQENPRLAGMPNAYAHTSARTCLCTHACAHTWAAHMPAYASARTFDHATRKKPLLFHTLVLNIFHYFTASSITVAVKPTQPSPPSNVNSAMWKWHPTPGLGVL